MNTEANGKSERGKTVLLVDDETMVLEVGKAILERLGHEVITAESAEEGLDLYHRNEDSIGCVVLDLTMPGMDGKEAFNQLRRHSADLPIIIASGLSADQVLGEFENMPPTAVIQKPYQIADLAGKISTIFKGARDQISPGS